MGDSHLAGSRVLVRQLSKTQRRFHTSRVVFRLEFSVTFFLIACLTQLGVSRDDRIDFWLGAVIGLIFAFVRLDFADCDIRRRLFGSLRSILVGVESDRN